MRTIGVGIAGFGFMGKTHAHALRDIPLFYEDAPWRPALRGVYCRRADAARAAAELLDIPFATERFGDLLARDDIDIVSICTPNETHLPLVLEALAAGKHVYVEKPMGMNLDECARIEEAQRASGKRLQVSQNNRFFPSVLRAKELVEEGRLGRITAFRFEYLHSGSIDPNRPAGWKQLETGGVLLDLGSHAADLLLYLAGAPESVVADERVLYPERPTRDGGRVRITAEDQVTALIRLKNGAIGTLEATKIATGSEDELSFELRGTLGALKWNGMRADYLEFFDNTLPDAPLGGARGFTSIACVQHYPAPGGKFLPGKNTIGWDRAHTHAWFSFMDAIYRDAPNHPDARDACETQRLLDAIRESRKTRGWVRV